MIEARKLNPKDWLVIKDMPKEMLLQNRADPMKMYTIVKGEQNED